VIAASAALARNPDSYASGNATSLLEAMAARGVIDEAAKPAFRRFVDTLYAPQLEAMGFDPRAGAHAGDDPDKAQRRVALVATLSDTARDPALRARLATAAEALLGGDKAALDPAFYGSGMRAWLGQAKLAGAQKLADIALGSEDPVFRPSALRAVAASGDADTARWVLDGFKDARLRPSERLSMIAGILVTPETREIGYTWLKAHLDEMLNGSAASSSPRGCPRRWPDSARSIRRRNSRPCAPASPAAAARWNWNAPSSGSAIAACSRTRAARNCPRRWRRSSKPKCGEHHAPHLGQARAALEHFQAVMRQHLSSLA
jgi:hypothetical protein